MSVTLHPATRADRPMIEELHLKTFADHVSREPSFELQPFIHEWFARWPHSLSWAHHMPFVCLRHLQCIKADGQTVGYIASRRWTNVLYRRPTHIHDIAIKEALYGQGVARAALRLFEQSEKQAGTFALDALVWRKNTRSHRLFQGMGFTACDLAGTAFDGRATHYVRDIRSAARKKRAERLNPAPTNP